MSDMIYWSAYNFAKHLLWIERKRTQAFNAAKEAGRNCEVNSDERQLIYKCLENFSRDCAELKFATTYQRAFELMVQVGVPHKPYYWSDIESGLQGIQWAVENELLLNTFVFIPSNKSPFFERDGDKALFGNKVYQNFKSVRADIKDAGNCLAADLHDAAVFYLMRVVETGLHELARNVKVKIPKTPLDYAGWKAVVTVIDVKLSAKIPKARGSKQSVALKFKHDLLADFKAFEVLRNDIMHGRSHHNEQEAIDLFNRVRDFMQRLDIQVFPAGKTNSTREIVKILNRADAIVKTMKKTK